MTILHLVALENSLFDFRIIDKEYILRNIGQERIFEHYLNIKVETKGLFCSPLREDNNPTCRFKYTKTGILMYEDFSGHFKGGCFDLVMFLYGVNFSDCLKIISNDFGIRDSNFKPKRKLKRHVNQVKIKEKAVIEVKWRDWTEKDLEYWNSYGVTITELKKYNVAPVSIVWSNYEIVYKFKESDTAYGYWFSKDDIKIYFPKRKDCRFLMNTNCIQGWNQLPESGDLLIITKSLKDVMVLDRLGYNAISYQSESQIPTEEEYKELSSRFKKIVTFYDFDLTGVRSSNKSRKKYGTIPIFLTNGKLKSRDYKAKDPSDLFKILKFDGIKEVLRILLEGVYKR